MSVQCDLDCADRCIEADDHLSSPCSDLIDWLVEPTEGDLMEGSSSFFELAFEETQTKRRKLADGSSEASKAKDIRSFKRDLARKRKLDPEAYKQEKLELSGIAIDSECDVKKQQQIIRNRISAQQSRDRKKAQLLTLEQENAKLRQKLEAIESEQNLLKSTLKMLDRSKLFRVFKGASMTLATFLSLCLLVNSLHDAKEVSSQLVKQLDQIDLSKYTDISGISLLGKSTLIFQDLLGDLELEAPDQSQDYSTLFQELAVKILGSKPQVHEWLAQHQPAIDKTKHLKAKGHRAKGKRTGTNTTHLSIVAPSGSFE